MSKSTRSLLRRLPMLTIVASALVSGSAALAAEAPAPAVRTITVSGQGEVRSEPDRALLTLGVEERRPQLNEARANVTRTVEALLQLTRELRIQPEFVHATRIAVQPEYNWQEPTRERVLTGYLVSRQVQVELRNLEQLGTLVERAVDLGANQISDPQLDSSRRQELARQALAAAYEDARLNAEALARAAGVRLGAPRTISATNVNAPEPPVRFRVAAAMADSGAAAASYRTGELTFGANVQVEFELP